MSETIHLFHLQTLDFEDDKVANIAATLDNKTEFNKIWIRLNIGNWFHINSERSKITYREKKPNKKTRPSTITKNPPSMRVTTVTISSPKLAVPSIDVLDEKDKRKDSTTYVLQPGLYDEEELNHLTTSEIGKPFLIKTSTGKYKWHSDIISKRYYGPFLDKYAETSPTICNVKPAFMVTSVIHVSIATIKFIVRQIGDTLIYEGEFDFRYVIESKALLNISFRGGNGLSIPLRYLKYDIIFYTMPPEQSKK